MVQAIPDWTETMTAKKFDDEFRHNGLKFEGPGLYLGPTDTMLVVPQSVEKEKIQAVWAKVQPEDTKYDVLVYNCPFGETILSVIATAPVRRDIDG